MQNLEFEKEVVSLEERIELLRNDTSDRSAQSVLEELEVLEKELQQQLKSIYGGLDSWQTYQVARHQDRPHTRDYFATVFTDFQELHGDRMFGDDAAIVGGLAKLDGNPVMVIGHQKGRGTEERIACNWGMPHPEGYRKSLRLMKLAAKFNLPLIALIDTPGAFCGIQAEERNISQAIGENLVELAQLPTRVISVVIGEGGSGGALALGVCDELLMLEHAVYSVITPEGCASILWKNGEGKPSQAANAMKMRAKDLMRLNLVDHVISEPTGGAHRDLERMSTFLREALVKSLSRLQQLTVKDCLDRRSKRLRGYGIFTEKRN